MNSAIDRDFARQGPGSPRAACVHEELLQGDRRPDALPRAHRHLTARDDVGRDEDGEGGGHDGGCDEHPPGPAHHEPHAVDRHAERPMAPFEEEADTRVVERHRQVCGERDERHHLADAERKLLFGRAVTAQIAGERGRRARPGGHDCDTGDDRVGLHAEEATEELAGGLAEPPQPGHRAGFSGQQSERARRHPRIPQEREHGDGDRAPQVERPDRCQVVVGQLAEQADAEALEQAVVFGRVLHRARPPARGRQRRDDAEHQPVEPEHGRHAALCDHRDEATADRSQHAVMLPGGRWRSASRTTSVSRVRPTHAGRRRHAGCCSRSSRPGRVGARDRCWPIRAATAA